MTWDTSSDPWLGQLDREYVDEPEFYTGEPELDTGDPNDRPPLRENSRNHIEFDHDAVIYNHPSVREDSRVAHSYPSVREDSRVAHSHRLDGTHFDSHDQLRTKTNQANPGNSGQHDGTRERVLPEQTVSDANTHHMYNVRTHTPISLYDIHIRHGLLYIIRAYPESSMKISVHTLNTFQSPKQPSPTYVNIDNDTWLYTMHKSCNEIKVIITYGCVWGTIDDSANILRLVDKLRSIYYVNNAYMESKGCSTQGGCSL
jgi:hypothetical protein